MGEEQLAPRSGAAPDEGLSERDRAMLELERTWWKSAAPKETQVRELFGMSSSRYHQVLNALIDRPEALQHDAVLVRRLRRLREARVQARTSRRRDDA